MKSFSKLLLLISIFLFISACSNDEQSAEGNEKGQTAEQTNQKENDKEKESGQKAEEDTIEVEPLPTTYEELAKLPVGKLVDFNPEIAEPEKTLEAFKGLPDILDNPSKQELDYFYRELLKLVQDEFKGPENLMKEMRFQAIGSPDMEDSRYQFKENLNVEIILDASGSMAQSIDGKTKMEIAKETITDFVSELPEGAKVGLRVYGHTGSNADSDMKLSCSRSDVVYPISPMDGAPFQTALDSVQPTGWTPTGLALREAKKDLEAFDGQNNTNIVYLVSDGVSTCNDDPVQAAKELYSSNISPIVNVIGFDVNAEGQNELIEIADATDGIYQKVNDESELKKEFDKISDLAQTWKDWKEKNTQALERKKVQNELDIFGYITEEGANATFEGTEIGLILFIFKENGKMDVESYRYLDKVNDEYHDWINSEVEKFEAELKSLNNSSYAEAIKALEEKYQQNTQ
ncbi:vWA domain-containing protein [Niallia endozanthoxylica]|uniref:VWA domain-containing protein n=1 Tax=Niallia endozanthoxylica TaxID=2036016 RepID=A0A5J5H5Y8_9BACI|nr:VWA domain-containing protein [Niallia endozanthoxylica]KAA9015981.1 VWA domain-containing protein [Niallia endozanthoxylica]